MFEKHKQDDMMQLGRSEAVERESCRKCKSQVESLKSHFQRVNCRIFYSSRCEYGCVEILQQQMGHFCSNRFIKVLIVVIAVQVTGEYELLVLHRPSFWLDNHPDWIAGIIYKSVKNSVAAIVIRT